MKKAIFLFSFVFLCLSSLGIAQEYLEEVQACHYLEQGKIDEALLLLNRKIKRYPYNYDCHLYVGLAYYLKGDFEKSLDILQKVEFETEKLEKAKGTMAAGKKLESFGQEDVFLAEGGGVVFSKEIKGILKFALGMLYRKNKNYENARKRFSDALKYNYPEIEARKQLCMTYSYLKDYKKAQSELERILEKTQRDDSLIFMEGFLSYGLKDEALALECFSKVSSSLVAAKHNLALVYYNKGDHQKALSVWEEISAQFPDDVDSLKNSGRAYFHLGQKEKAQEQFDKMGLKIKVEKYSPKKIPLMLEDFFVDVVFDFQCK
ncbi:MAG: tetratricopeptide repeat protein [Candidatus Aminicenantes bacterium]|nr:tetratricopeptide repeat protein [Candidatus Aminicenantes bacterium]